MAKLVRGVNLLQNELEKAKESLKDVDENIKKLTGRDPTEQRGQQRSNPQRRVWSVGESPRGKDRDGRIESRLFSLARRGIVDDSGPSPKRRAVSGGAFSRLGPRPARDQGVDSGDEDELPNKPTVQSSVVATPKDIRTRQKSIDEQSKDSAGQARNRRMFGHILGTLQRFKDDAKHCKEKEEQRKVIEKKLDEKFKQEKEEILKERKQLFEERKQKQKKIRLLEQKMELAKNHEDWERETRKLECFIRTKAKPHVFYMPRSLTTTAQTKLQETKKIIDAIIEERRKCLQDEIEDLMSQASSLDDGEADGEGDEGEERDDDDESEDGEIREKKSVENKENKKDRRHSDGRGRRDSGQDSDEDTRDKSRDRHVRTSSNDRDRKDRSRDRRDHSGDRPDRSRDRKNSERDGKESRRDRKDSESDRKDRSRDRKDSERDRKDREHRDRNHRSSRDEVAIKDRRRSDSGKDRSGRKRSGDHNDHSERSHGHQAKSRKRSRGESKVERKEKVWEPMEDEDEEEEEEVRVKEDLIEGGGEGDKGLGSGSSVSVQGTQLEPAEENGEGGIEVQHEPQTEKVENSVTLTPGDKLVMPEDAEEMDYEGETVDE